MLEDIRNRYDLILIDVSTDSKYKDLRKILVSLSSNIVCLLSGNLVEIRKTVNILNEYQEEKEKIKLVYNKKSKYGIKKSLLEIIFFKYKMIGSLTHDNSYNKIINKNVNKLYINKNIRREFEKIINKLQII